MININKNELYKLFPLPCESIETTGEGDGIILKFKTFYLKIYDGKMDEYIVKGYRYNTQIPVFEDIIKSINMRRYASMFRFDNYLNNIKYSKGIDIMKCNINFPCPKNGHIVDITYCIGCPNSVTCDIYSTMLDEEYNN